MEDLSLRNEFHLALDAVTPPAPWLAEHVRQGLRRRRQAMRPWQRRRSTLVPVLSPRAMRLIAVALVVLLAATAAWVSIAIHLYAHHPVPIIPRGGAVTRECGQGSVYMVDANVGWQGTQRTTDGGKTWKDVSPPLEPGAVKGGGTVCALDAGHAWVTYGTGTDSYQPTQVVVMSTSDGGQSWQQISAIPIGFPVSWRIGFLDELNFYDDLHGWLLMEYASSPVVRKLYATSDGGVHWSLVSRAPGLGLGTFTIGCSESGMMFASLQRGWLAWDCSSGYGDQPPAGGPVIAFTEDGGLTWAPLNLEAFPTGRTCGATTPIFSRSHGLLQITCLGTFPQGGWTALYSSADGGQTWAVNVLPVFAKVDLVDGNTGFYFHRVGNSNTLYRTTNGGKDWTVVQAGLFPDNDAGVPIFVDANTGFVNAGGPSPWWTHDGGKTWSLPAPYRSVGSTVCDVYAEPATGPVPNGLKMVSPTIGWAAGARRTTDGGATWSRVAPPAPKNRASGYAEYFLDPTHAWVVDAVGSSTACADQFVVFSTADGGATWRQGMATPVQLPPQDKLEGRWHVSLDFVDPDHGWLALQPYAGFARGTFADLYATSDGGRHWSVVNAQPGSNNAGCRAVGGPSFISITTGWMEVQCSNQDPTSPLQLLVTRDGGATWTIKTLAEHACCSNVLPHFIDASNGWILDPNTPWLLMTSDGGETWTRHGLPRFTYFTCQGKFGPTTCSNQNIVSGTFISPTEGWMIVTEWPGSGSTVDLHVERTTDGGRTWTVLNTQRVSGSADLGFSIGFVDSDNGFMWSAAELLRTTDGGRTWSAVQVTYS